MSFFEKLGAVKLVLLKGCPNSYFSNSPERSSHVIDKSTNSNSLGNRISLVRILIVNVALVDQSNGHEKITVLLYGDIIQCAVVILFLTKIAVDAR